MKFSTVAFNSLRKVSFKDLQKLAVNDDFIYKRIYESSLGLIWWDRFRATFSETHDGTAKAFITSDTVNMLPNRIYRFRVYVPAARQDGSGNDDDNNFRISVEEDNSSNTLVMWRSHDIPNSTTQDCHLICPTIYYTPGLQTYTLKLNLGTTSSSGNNYQWGTTNVPGYFAIEDAGPRRNVVEIT